MSTLRSCFGFKWFPEVPYGKQKSVVTIQVLPENLKIRSGICEKFRLSKRVSVLNQKILHLLLHFFSVSASILLENSWISRVP